MKNNQSYFTMLISVSLLVCISFGLYSQNNSGLIEFDKSDGSGNYHLVVLEEGSLLMNSLYSGKLKKWKFTLFDKELKKEWETEELISSANTFISFYDDKKEKTVYFLFTSNSSRSFKKEGKFVVVSVSYDNLKITVSESYSPVDANITSFAVIERKAYIGGQTISPVSNMCCGEFLLSTVLIKKKRAAGKSSLIAMDMDNKTTEVIPMLVKGNSVIYNITESYDRNYLNVFIKAVDKGRITTILERYDNRGRRLLSMEILPDDSGICALNAYLNTDDSKKSIAVGTGNIATFHNEMTSTAHGIYCASLKDGKTESFRFYNFAKIESYKNALPDAAKTKLQKMITEASSKGREARLALDVVLHDPVLFRGEYIVVVECFKPYQVRVCTQNQCSYMTVGYFCNYIIVLAFDHKGDLLWDHTIDTESKFAAMVTKTVNVSYLNDRIHLSYIHGKSMHLITLKGGQPVGEKIVKNVETSFNRSNIREEGYSYVRHIQGDAYLAYGHVTYHHIAFNAQFLYVEQAHNKDRYYFFMNLIEID